MTTRLAAFGVWVSMGASLVAGGQATSTADRAEVVSVTGCLKEAAPNTWTLVNATDPIPSTANAPSAKELASMPRTGKNQYQLIGVGVFNVASHRDHTVVVKGLEIKGKGMSRLNVTSLTMVSASCDSPRQAP